MHSKIYFLVFCVKAQIVASNEYSRNGMLKKEIQEISKNECIRVYIF